LLFLTHLKEAQENVEMNNAVCRKTNLVKFKKFSAQTKLKNGIRFFGTEEVYDAIDTEIVILVFSLKSVTLCTF